MVFFSFVCRSTSKSRNHGGALAVSVVITLSHICLMVNKKKGNDCFNRKIPIQAGKSIYYRKNHTVIDIYKTSYLVTHPFVLVWEFVEDIFECFAQL